MPYIVVRTLQDYIVLIVSHRHVESGRDRAEFDAPRAQIAPSPARPMSGNAVPGRAPRAVGAGGAAHQQLPDVASCLRLNHLPNGFQRHQPDALSARWRSLHEANSDRDFTRDVTVDDRTRAASLVAASAVAIDEISGLAV